ncbi:MAG: hypothetical protein JO009_03925 [Candidatus Eremiobacteraeota bacterium]|nr:hypothetical protein [Candidatus Eremiobacteraeota bacterium]
MSNVRVVRDAWGAFAVWCVMVVGAVWIAEGKIYDFQLANARSAVESLMARVTVLEGENRDFQAQLASKIGEKPPPPQRDPDGLYQLGEFVAQAPSGQIDRVDGIVRFNSIIGGPNFNVHDTIEYRQFALSGCSFDVSSEKASMGIVTSVDYAHVTCRISEVRP